MVRKTLTTPAKSLADWMDRTGTNGTELAKMVKARGITMTRQQLSNILRRAKPCRLATAIALSEITGVPVQKLIAWGKSKRHFGKTTSKVAKNETSGAAA